MQKSYFLKSTGERVRFLMEEKGKGGSYIRCLLAPSQPWHNPRIQNIRLENLEVRSSNI